ncbi:hypothetical protein THAOC_14206, partial [Thalassiosira oceanica]
PASVTVVAPP